MKKQKWVWNQLLVTFEDAKYVQKFSFFRNPSPGKFSCFDLQRFLSYSKNCNCDLLKPFPGILIILLVTFSENLRNLAKEEENYKNEYCNNKKSNLDETRGSPQSSSCHIQQTELVFDQISKLCIHCIKCHNDSTQPNSSIL